MLVPLSWLEEFIELEGVSAEQIADALSMRSVEAYVHTFGIKLEGAVTGVVREAKPHPGRKNLLVLRVDLGGKSITIVTADTSLSVGDEVFVVPEGGIVGDRGVKPVEFDGVRSEGMLLSAQELGLEDSSAGVLKFREGIPAGRDVGQLLGFGEKLIELDITPNRGDVLSVRGLSRELSALLGLKKKPRETEKLNDTGELPIEIEDEDCLRYRGVVIRNLTISSSPLSVRKRLWQCGIKSINNVVDITNYILLQEGQPLHAFDIDKIEGSVKVRSAKEGEALTTLDGEERKLNPEVLIIADSAKPLAVAGVIGGLESGVTENTKNILLESAYFRPQRVRRSSKLLGVRTESSYRFERNTDIEWVDSAQDIAVLLTKKFCGGEVTAVRDVYVDKYQPKKVFLSMGKFMRYAGESYKNDEAGKILSSLEIPYEIKRCGIEVLIPSHRSFDLSRDVDIIEELMRVKGYDHFGSEQLKLPSIGKRPADLIASVKRYLRDKGLVEVINISFEEKDTYEALNLSVPKTEVLNPLVPSQRFMRSSLIPSLLRTYQFNENYYNHDIAIFEVGNIFTGEGEEPALGILVKGSIREFPPEKWDTLKLSEIIWGLGALFGKELTAEPSEYSFLHPRIQAKLCLDDREVGFIGKLNPAVSSKLELESDPALCEIKLRDILTSKRPVYRHISKFPPVIRDLAFVVDKNLSVSKLLNEIKSHLSGKVEEVMVFDIYAGEKVGEGKKSVGVRIAFRTLEGSLSNEEVNELVENLVRRLKNTLRVDIR